MTAEQLQQLCKTNGIGFEFEDCRGQWVQIKPETQHKILQAMSACVSSDPHDHKAQPILPALHMVQLGEPLQIPVNSPLATSPITCTLHLDGGGKISSQLLACNNSYTLDTNGPLGLGVHRLCIQADAQTMILIVVPKRCYQPPVLEQHHKIFGLSLQLYTLRSHRNWGIGDFADLKHHVIDAASQGVDLIGVNPLHALFPANPLAFSPYSPSHRAFFNIMYIAPELIPEFIDCTAANELVNSVDFQARLQALRATAKVDYQGVAACKFEVFKLVFEYFKSVHIQHNTARAKAFYRYINDRGEPLRLHALHDALHSHFFTQNNALWGWPTWPEAYKNIHSEAVILFAEQYADDVLYYQYLQWCVEEQLSDVQHTALAQGMAVGIYLDVAVGVNAGGSEAWANQSVFCFQASTGAPPDNLATEGQDWGFPPLHPRALRHSGYDVFLQNLRASMRHSGAVRFDHCVALMRLWWVPQNNPATDGAYVHYPFEELLGLLALESYANRCMVIGEDLGTVPEGLRPKMAEKAMYAYRVMYFEIEKGTLLPPAQYTPKAVATINTHDVAPLVSWWDGSDIRLRRDLGVIASDEIYDFLCMERNMHKQCVLNSLFAEGLINEPQQMADIPEMTRELNEAIHVFLASSTAQIVMSQLEDWLNMASPVNIPGTSDEYDNWQRKLDSDIEGFFEREENLQLIQKIMQARVTKG